MDECDDLNMVKNISTIPQFSLAALDGYRMERVQLLVSDTTQSI
jgi:hypothetical protein